MTWPSIDDVAIMLMEAVRLFGVNTTSNRLAVKPESSWHDARELERSTYSALVGTTRAAREEIRRSGLIDGNRMVAGMPVGAPVRADGLFRAGCRGKHGG